MIGVDTTYLPPGSGIVVACSGGGDSVALLHLLAAERRARDWELVVAHLDHGLRPAAAAEAAFVRALAGELELPCLVERCRVKQERRPGESIESAARRLRYAFLRAVRDDRLPGGLIATGHTLDDQLETLALRLERGAGLRGLRGILPRRADGVVRPLMGVRRDELRAWLGARSLTWCEDETNRDVTLARNRWRQLLAELVEERYAELLAAAARLGRAAERLQPPLEALARWWLDGGGRVTQKPTGTGEAAGAVAFLPGEIVLESLSEGADLGMFDQALLEAALEGAGTDPRTVSSRVRQELLRLWRREGASGGGALAQIAPDLWAEATAGGLLLVRGSDPDWASGAGWNAEIGGGGLPPEGGTLALPRGGRLRWREAEAAVLARLREGERIPGLDGRRRTVLPRPRAGEPLRVRYPHRGDRMHPFGLAGTSGLGDLFNEAGVPRLRRARLPVVERAGQILWLAGVRTAEGARIGSERTALEVNFDPLAR